MSFKSTAFAVLMTTLSFFSACTPQSATDGSPRQRLADYISISFDVKNTSDKDRMMGFLTGEAKNRLGAWSEEQFRQAFIETKRQFVKLTIREIKSINDHETNVTYEISYIDQGKGNTARVTNKRLAEMVKENDKWFIRNVQNLRELIEYKDAMSLP